MKAQKLHIRFFFREGEEPEPDGQNRTRLYINGQLCWPIYNEDGDYIPFAPQDISPGDNICLRIPSGDLSCQVHTTWHEGGVFIASARDAEWQGHAGGLAGGASGICNFDVVNDYMPGTAEEIALVTQTSACDGELAYSLYEAVRHLASYAAPSSKQKEKAAVMRRLLAVLLREDELATQTAPPGLTARRGARPNQTKGV